MIMAVAVVLNLLYIYLMAKYTSVFGMISLVLIEIGMVYFFGVFVYLAFTEGMNRGVYVFVAVITGLFVVIFNCVLCANWTNFKVAIAVIDATANFFVATKRLVIVSLIFAVFSMLTFAYFGSSLLIQYSGNTIEPG
jgi:hypothetical protein